MVGNYTYYFAESQGRKCKKVEKSFGGGRPVAAPTTVKPTETCRLVISTNQGFGISGGGRLLSPSETSTPIQPFFNPDMDASPARRWLHARQIFRDLAGEPRGGWMAAVVNRVVFCGFLPGVFLLAGPSIRPRRVAATIIANCVWMGVAAGARIARNSSDKLR